MRALVGPLVLGLLGVAPLGVIAPAQANIAEAVGTPTRIVASTVSSATFREEFPVEGHVEYSDGTTSQQVPPGSGAVVLMRRMKGSDTWTTIETDESGETFDFRPIAKGNADYRLEFQGDEITYASSDLTFDVHATRLLIDRVVEATLTLKGKVRPSWKRKRVVVQVKKNGAWRRYDVVRTDRRSRYSSKLYSVAGGKRTRFRAYVPGNEQFVKTFTNVYITFQVGRTATSRTAR